MSGKDSFILLFLLLCIAITDGTNKALSRRVRRNSANLTRNVDDFYFYTLEEPSNIFAIRYGGGNMYAGGTTVYYTRRGFSFPALGGEIYRRTSFTFTTIDEVPFTAMYLFKDNSGSGPFSIKVRSDLGVYGGKFETFEGSVSLRSYTLQFGGAQVYSVSQYPTVCEVYYFLALTKNSRHTFSVATPKPYRRRMENNATVKLDGGQAVMGYTLLSKIRGLRVSKEEIKTTMLTMMRIILGGSPENVFTRIRNSAANLTRNIKNFNPYILPGRYIDSTGGGSMYYTGSYITFKVGDERYYSRAAYNKTYTGKSYTFTAYSIVPLTAMYIIGDNSGPENYSLRVFSALGSDERGKLGTFEGSVSLRNYTLQYRVAQIYSSVINPTVCEVYYFLPLTPNSNRTFNLTTSIKSETEWQGTVLVSMTNLASVQYGGGQAVLGYTLLSKYSGLLVSKKEISETMLTMMRIILDGGRSRIDIFERLEDSHQNLTRNIANFFHYRLKPAFPKYTVSPWRSNLYLNGPGNKIHFKAGNAPRRIAAYNKTYTGPSYIFATYSIHPFTAMYFLDANSGPESYSIEVTSALRAQGKGILDMFNGSVSLQNYTLKYSGAQVYFYTSSPTVCEVYFYLPLTSNYNRTFSLVIQDQESKEFKNNASVHSGEGEAFFGYTLLSKPKGVQIWKKEIEATMLTMLHVILGVDQSVWSLWTAWSPNCHEKGTQSRTRICTSGPCLQTSNTVETQNRPCSPPAWVAGIFERVRTNTPDLSRNVNKYQPYNLSTTTNARSINYLNVTSRGNYVYFSAGQEPVRLATYNKSYTGDSYFFETFAIHPFTAMFVLDGNSGHENYSIEVKSKYYSNSRGELTTSRGSVSLRNYTLLFIVAQLDFVWKAPVHEVYYILPLTPASNYTLDLVIKLREDNIYTRYTENRASVQSGGGPAIFGYTLLLKINKVVYQRRFLMKEIRDTMLSMMHLILGIDEQVWSPWTHWSSCPDNCPRQLAQRRFRTGTIVPAPNSASVSPNETRIGTETRPCSIPNWVTEIVERFRSGTRYLTRSVDKFYRYQLPIPSEITSFVDHSTNKPRNAVLFKVGNKRFERAKYNRKYTGSSYTFTTFATHPFTAMFVLDGDSIPTKYAIKVFFSDLATDGSKMATFRGSVVWRNYTMQYGGTQVFARSMSTICQVFFVLPLTPDSTLELILVKPSRRTRSVENEASVPPGGAVLGYTFLSKPYGLKVSEDEIKAAMLTMMQIILDGDKSEILERVRSNLCKLTRDVANYNTYQLPARSEESLIENGGENMYEKGNKVYFKVGNEPRILSIYNKTYRDPSYLFTTFAVHPFTAFFFLGDNSGPQQYMIQVISTLGSAPHGQFSNLHSGEVSLRNYTLEYRGAQTFASSVPTTCEVYFSLPLEANSNRQFRFLPIGLEDEDETKIQTMQNEGLVVWGGGKAVLGYTLLSKPNGEVITQKDVYETMLAMLHILIGADYPVWSFWTSWTDIPNSCRASGNKTRTRKCTSGPCLQTSITVQTESRPFRDLKCKAEEIFDRFRKMYRTLTRQVNHFHFYEFSTGFEQRSIKGGGQYMYDVGNKVYFKEVNGAHRSAIYGKRYMGDSYIFETITVHPFTALFVVHFDSVADIYSILVHSDLGADGLGEFGTFNGLIYLRNNTLQYGGVQSYDSYTATVCEVYFFLPLSGNAKLKVYSPYKTGNYIINGASVRSKSGQGVFGYTLLSKTDSKEISKKEIEATMSRMMEIILID